jgi:hypothetical protein
VSALRRGAAAALLASGCAVPWSREPAAPWWPDREEYYAFRAAHPEIVEPNYLPFMAHAVPLGRGRGHALVLCRWDEERFPLAVWIEPPRIPDELQDEFAPIPPEAFVAAVEAALGAWERELEGLVRFRRVDAAADAALRVQLVAEVAPAPEPTMAVLGQAEVGRACRVRGEGAPDRLDVEFAADELRVYLADDYGLLNPDQIERVALHELGHALGMRRHSPVPADLMFAIARDSLSARAPSAQDVNSFVSLYSLPNGTLYAPLAPDAAARPLEPAAGPPPGPPRLAAAPHVDARFGYELRLPEGWQSHESERGMIATDGLAWDYDATFQVIVRAYDSIDAYLERHGAAHVGAGRVVEQSRLVVDDRPGLRWVVMERAGPMVEELTFLELGDGRVVIVIADCPAGAYAAWRPWFDAALATLEIRSLAPRAARRPHGP